MSILDYKYGHSTVQERFREMLGLNSGIVGWGLRLALLAFIIRTSSNPAEHIYVGYPMWAVIVFFIFFYVL